MFSLRFIIGFLVAIVSFHIFATIKYWYWAVLWLDIPMHFLGGFWAALVFFWLREKTRINHGFPINADLRANQRNRIGEKSAIIISCLGFVALVGVLWEFAEFLHDIFALGAYLQQGAADTIGDLFFDLLGGATAAVIFLIRKNKTNSAS